MSFRRRWLSTAIALTVAACAAGTAQTVTVDVQGVPLHEVIEQLKLEGDVEILTPGLPADLLELPVSYKAEDVPVKRALREICRPLGLRLHTYGTSRRGGHVFRVVGMRPDEAEPPSGQAGPYAVRLTCITRMDVMTLDFRRRAEPMTFRRHLQLEFEAEADTDENAQALVAFHPAVVVTDNTGKTLEPAREELGESARDRGGHIWNQKMTGTVDVGSPAPEALSLATVAGELVVAAKVTPLRFEFDAAKQGATITKDGYTLTLESVEVTPTGRCHVDFMLLMPVEPDAKARQGIRGRPDATCTIVLDDGTEVREQMLSARGRQGAEGIPTWQITCGTYGFPAGAKPHRVLYSFSIRSDETKRIPFKFENIPLPTWGQ